MNKQIKINREWFERLLQLRKNLTDDKDIVKLDRLNHFLGYIDSIEFLLKKI